MLNKVDHVAIAVHDLEAAIDHYRRLYGVEPSHRETIDDQLVEEALIPVGESLIQLLMPTSPDSTVAKFLERNGEGLHHVGYEVPELTGAIDHLKDIDARLIEAEPRHGSRYALIEFGHKKGVLRTLS